MEDEEWRPVVGETRYFVSNKGRVKNDKGQIMSTKGRSKYPAVIFSNLGLCRKESVHRLVALAFIPNPEAKPLIDHINGNKHDNRVENLRWATHAENQYNKKGYNGMKKGVCLTKHGTYQASMTHNKKSVYIGCFPTEQEAHEAYCKKAQELFGDYFKSE
jgi:HNH endonuclease/NUMOD4 motif